MVYIGIPQVFMTAYFDDVVQNVSDKLLIDIFDWLEDSTWLKKSLEGKELNDTLDFFTKPAPYYNRNYESFVILCGLAMHLGLRIHEGHLSILASVYERPIFAPLMKAMKAAIDGYKNDGTRWDFDKWSAEQAEIERVKMEENEKIEGEKRKERQRLERIRSEEIRKAFVKVEEMRAKLKPFVTDPSRPKRFAKNTLIRCLRCDVPVKANESVLCIDCQPLLAGSEKEPSDIYWPVYSDDSDEDSEWDSDYEDEDEDEDDAEGEGEGEGEGKGDAVAGAEPMQVVGIESQLPAKAEIQVESMAWELPTPTSLDPEKNDLEMRDDERFHTEAENVKAKLPSHPESLWPPPLHTCSNCLSDKTVFDLVICPGCHSVAFCSKDCQAHAQSAHESTCPGAQSVATMEEDLLELVRWLDDGDQVDHLIALEEDYERECRQFEDHLIDVFEENERYLVSQLIQFY